MEFFSFIGDINVQKEESFKKFDQQINDVKNGKIKFKEVFIIQVKELSEEIIKSFLKKFNDMEEYYQPFIIFIPLTKNKTENEQNINKITKEFNKIDKRNIICEQNLDNVKKKVCQFCAYYNELGDIFYDHENFFAYINIFLLEIQEVEKVHLLIYYLMKKEQELVEMVFIVQITLIIIKFKIIQ